MEMPKTIPASMLAACGVNCMVCYKHVKNKNACSGCNHENKNKTERCKNCAIKLCAVHKGSSHCFLCGEFPCVRIKNLDKSYLERYGVSLIKNGEIAKEKGVAFLLEKEKLKWTCTGCNGAVSLNDGICSGCGKTIR